MIAFPVDISVIMSTYNTDIHMLEAAVNSILNQTFRDYEFIIIDDGSTNGSRDYLMGITDERVKIIYNHKNIGITKSLNIGLRVARGKYIARMDADDISMPTRFEKEYYFMEKHPEVVVCGTMVDTIDEKSNISKRSKRKQKSEDMETYRIKMVFMNPGPWHPTVFFRHEILLKNKILYDENLIYAQDYGMWETISHYGIITRLQEVLLLYRKHEKQISIARRDEQIRCDKMVKRRILTALLGDVSDEEIDFHFTYSSDVSQDAVITPAVSQWYDRLLQANKTRRIYNQRKLRKRIITQKKNLIRQTVKKNVSIIHTIGITFRYLPFFSAIRALAGIHKQK